MRMKQLVSAWLLLHSVVEADCGNSLDIAGSSETLARVQPPSLVGAEHLTTEPAHTRVSSEKVVAGGSSSGSSAFVISVPGPTTTSKESESKGIEAPVATTEAPSAAAVSTPATPKSPSDQSGGATSSAVNTSDSSDIGTSKKTSTSITSTDESPKVNGTTTSSSSGMDSMDSRGSKDDDASIASAEPDSSTFQLVESHNCSDSVVDNVYTLYSNCRSAFDLCVSASDYQIFPYPGKHPTHAQIQGMTESDACVAVFIIVIEANISACTIGGMPLISAVETLLKISVDLDNSSEDVAPSAEEFQELLAWRYEVDLAKAADVPYDGDSQLYAEFQTNIDAVLANTTIQVNKDLSVDVRLANGSYESFEDALDLVITDASTDATPGYVKASSADAESSSGGGSQSAMSESFSATSSHTSSLWSLVVLVVASTFVAGWTV